MIFDFQTMYLMIATFYTTISLSLSVLRKDENFSPFLVGFISMIVSVFIGWLLFPILVFYNLVIRKTFI